MKIDMTTSRRSFCRLLYNVTQLHNVAIDNANSMHDDT